MSRHIARPQGISPIGAIPKKHKPGKWRLIMDLSSPAGSSINDGISSEWSSISYVSIDFLLSWFWRLKGLYFSQSRYQRSLQDAPYSSGGPGPVRNSMRR